MKGGVLLGRKPEEGGGDSKGIICYSVLYSSSILALGLREIQTRRRRASNNKQVGILKRVSRADQQREELSIRSPRQIRPLTCA